MKRLFATIAALIVLASCSGGNSSPPGLDEVTAEPIVIDESQEVVTASLDYKPESDGFSFENFGGGEAPAALTVNMVRRLYGDHQVCSEVVDNKCTPFPVVLQLISQANRSMAAGLCEGFAVLTLRLANDANKISEYQSVTDVAELAKDDPRLLSEIAYWYTTQFAFEVAEEAEKFLSMTPAEIAETLSEDFSRSETGSSVGYTLGLYSDAGGHAVTPYKVDQITDKQWRIYIYDSNHPSQERWIDIEDERWSYNLAALNPQDTSSGWSGSTGTMELTPMTSRKGPFTCPFCPQDNKTKSGTLLTVATSGEEQLGLQIVDGKNNRLGWFDGEFINEIPGSSYRYLISRGTADPVLVYLPPEVETYDADVSTVQSQEQTPDDEQDETTKFSLLVLDENQAVQIEAPVESVETSEGEEQESLIQLDNGEVEIDGLEGGTVEIAVEDVAIEIDTSDDTDIEFELDEVNDETGEEQDIVLEIDILDDETGEVLVETDIAAELEEDAAPIEYELVFDEDTGEITTSENQIEAWVASDAEFFQAVATDTVDEILGDTWIEELAEDDLFIVVDPDEDDFEWDFIDDDYWDDDYWEPDDYDADYFIEEYEEWVEFDLPEGGDDDPFQVVDPVLIGEETVLEEILVRSYMTETPDLVSVNTTRTEIYQDAGGTLTETWRDTSWIQTITVMSWEEIQQRNGVIQTFLIGQETQTETIWEQETSLIQIPIQETQTVSSWITTELIAAVRECQWRENLPVMMVNQMEKPSGCATPMEPVISTAQVDEQITVTETVTEAIDDADGYWYETTETDTLTETTFVDTTVVEWSDGFVDTTIGDPYVISTEASETLVETIDCGLSDGWSEFGDTCVADIDTFNERDEIVFEVSGNETQDIVIVARTSLTCGGWPGINEEEEFGDPYIYLFDDTTDELIQQDDDGGCDCGTYEECGESGNCWDSAITRTLNPGTYRLEVDVYSQETTGYYNVTIQENQETEEP